ncbi:MAG: sialate O-acetylesterase [Flavobacterium sp.]|nr:sialate O-acetylesterase [Pedobacter sp.]
MFLILNSVKTTLYLFVFFYLLLFFETNSAFAVSVPDIFSNHVVLQQNAEITLWGWAKTGEKVTVSVSWDQKKVNVTANNLAQWKVTLNTPFAGGPYTIKIEGYNTIQIEDVLIGEVWLASGQSNMEWTPKAGIDGGEQEVAKANYPNIRFFTVDPKTADATQLNVSGEWVVCTPQTMSEFSAVGYFFGKKLYQNLNTPVGIINSSWGGTPAEVWMNPKVIEENKLLKSAASSLKEVPWGPVIPGKAYYAMIAPLIPFKIAGVIWYQGEANTSIAESYSELLSTLIASWRQEWGYEFPFYYVQIAPFKYKELFAGAILRDEQRQVLAVPKTGMVVVSDIGNIEDIHPKNKRDVGIRLANLALAKTYNKHGLPVSGPLYKEMKLEGNKVRLFFDYAENGLIIKGKELSQFEIAGADKNFVKATAKIEGSSIVVQAKNLKHPVAIRFAWSNIAEPNLFNKDGLPASTFRTDNW